jgi:hypothetical protein
VRKEQKRLQKENWARHHLAPSWWRFASCTLGLMIFVSQTLPGGLEQHLVGIIFWSFQLLRKIISAGNGFKSWSDTGNFFITAVLFSWCLTTASISDSQEGGGWLTISANHPWAFVVLVLPLLVRKFCFQKYLKIGKMVRISERNRLQNNVQ